MRFSYMGEKLTSIEVMKDKLNSLLITISNDISIKKVKKNVELISSFKKGVIGTSFYEAAIESDIPDSVIMDFAYIFGWDVDFVFDIRESDRFYVIYETPYSNGEQVENGDIVFAKFINNKNTYFANRFYNEDGKKEYFDSKGNNMQKAFLKAPLDFAYISSHFNPNRMHPVLHTIRAHNGVDYAAKRGTPIRATGEGVIESIGWKGGYGRTIVIRHGGEITTLYAHMEKYHSLITKGSKVQQGQTIGYVGDSGLATAPHLHYEFRIGNKRTDPLKVPLPSASPLKKSLLVDFQALQADYVQLSNHLLLRDPNEAFFK